MSRVFFDSNILVYALVSDSRSDVADRLLEGGGVISTQSLNELANVLLRKEKWSWGDVRRATRLVALRCGTIVDLDLDIHHLGLRIAERYTLSVYDGMIAAAALTADCDILYSEDMHHGLVIDGRVRIVNPFAPA